MGTASLDLSSLGDIDLESLPLEYQVFSWIASLGDIRRPYHVINTWTGTRPIIICNIHCDFYSNHCKVVRYLLLGPATTTVEDSRVSAKSTMLKCYWGDVTSKAAR